MKTIIFSDAQAAKLEVYLLATTQHRLGEASACERLAGERNEDGSPLYPNMTANAAWWREADVVMKGISKLLAEADSEEEAK